MQIGELVTGHDYSVAMRVSEIDLTVLDAAITDTLYPGYVHLARVNVPFRQRKKGYGNQLMEKFCELLDRDQKYAWLEINSYGSMNNASLREWYAKFGFEPHAVDEGVYVRAPKEVTNENPPVD